MRIRREQAFFVGAVAVLGLMLKSDLSSVTVRTSGGEGGALALARHELPDLASALPATGERPAFRRDLFSPPSDTLPLPALELHLPPFEALPALAPPSAWGPSVRHAHRLLRREVVVQAAPDLFAEAEGVEDASVDAEGEESGAAPRVTNGEVPAEEALDRASMIEGYKRLYDWVRIPTLQFGHIRNEDRFGLAQRPEEKLLWVEVDPQTGVLRYSGLVAEIGRERVQEFGFADTPANRLELGRRALGDELRPAQLEAALAFAEECLAWRNEVPRALALAEEVFTMAQRVAEGDPRPELGLARCLELGFRFEDAFDAYERLTREVSAAEVVLVHARYADLLARFRMFARAEEHFALALQRASQSWEARFRYGRYLLERGRTDPALANLALAHEHEPRFPEAKLDRSAVRVAYASALLQAGRLPEAIAAFERALGNDADDPRALAGLFAAALHAGAELDAEHAALLDEALEHGLAGAEMELLLTLGLAAIERGEWETARANLERAAEADPFRAHLAWRALSWLAEITGHPDEALRWIQLAHECDPTDAWTLYQRGRMLLAAEDSDLARASLEAALEREADFVDALVLLGEIAQLDGRHDDAELYYERALALDPEQPRVHARRGFNFLARNEIDAARESFARAPGVASASLGLAWCAYALGDPSEAAVLLGDIADERRNASADDPWRAWAETEIARILDHESKEVWIDRFDRRAGDPANGWQVELGTGLDVGIVDGRVVIEGQISSPGRTRLWRPIPASDFVNFQAQVTVDEGTVARAGVFVALERKAGPTESKESASAMLSRNKDGAVQSRFVQSGNADAQHVDLPLASWPAGRPVAVRIERSGEGNESDVTIYLDGVPVVERVRVAALGTTTNELRLGIFVEGDPARKARVVLDDVELVRRTAKR